MSTNPDNLRQKPKFGWFDVLMILIGTIPLWMLLCVRYFSLPEGLPEAFYLMLWLIFVSGCIGFPATALLYFFWRLRRPPSEISEISEINEIGEV